MTMLLKGLVTAAASAVLLTGAFAQNERGGRGAARPVASQDAAPAKPFVDPPVERLTLIEVRRFAVVSSKPYDEIVIRLSTSIGHPDMKAFHSAVTASRTVADLQEVVQRAIGPSQLMEFARFDVGEILRKEGNRKGPKSLRLVVGNPLIMKEMAKTVPDAAAYAPVTILVDERADGVHLSYDLMASLIASYGSQPALVVARDLDAKIESLLRTAAR